jgi:hypothetical protein
MPGGALSEPLLLAGHPLPNFRAARADSLSQSLHQPR